MIYVFIVVSTTPFHTRRRRSFFLWLSICFALFFVFFYYEHENKEIGIKLLLTYVPLRRSGCFDYLCIAYFTRACGRVSSMCRFSKRIPKKNSCGHKTFINIRHERKQRNRSYTTISLEKKNENKEEPKGRNTCVGSLYETKMSPQVPRV